MTKSQIFAKAWATSRSAAVQFGGSVKSYFAESLKMVYRSIKVISVEALVKIGGKHWVKNDMNRVYFNADVIAEMIDFSYNTYKTGNISSACLGDKSIANGRAAKIRTAINCCKFWFDMTEQKFHIKDFFQCDVSFDDIAAAFRNAL